MQDLYAKLGIDQSASRSEVATALQTRPELSADSSVLLNAERRAVYDRAHTALKVIGRLRHNLGLDAGDSWFLQNCPDYVIRQRSAVTAEKPGPAAGTSAPRQQPRELANPPAAPAKPLARSVLPVAMVLAIAAVVLALVAYVLL
jgi:hypothetical protein